MVTALLTAAPSAPNDPTLIATRMLEVGGHCYQCWVVAGHQGAAVNNAVTIAVEIVKKGRADIVQRWHGAAPYKAKDSFAFRLAALGETVHNTVAPNAKSRGFDAPAFRFLLRGPAISRPKPYRLSRHLPYGNQDRATPEFCLRFPVRRRDWTSRRFWHFHAPAMIG